MLLNNQYPRKPPANLLDVGTGLDSRRYSRIYRSHDNSAGMQDSPFRAGAMHYYVKALIAKRDLLAVRDLALLKIPQPQGTWWSPVGSAPEMVPGVADPAQPRARARGRPKCASAGGDRRRGGCTHARPAAIRNRTVADYFEFRNKIGLDVALEALTDAWRS
jgi:hypothetical protein